MKTINKRVEELENRGGAMPILVLWGDLDNPDICRVGDDNGEIMAWAEAKKAHENTHTIICVRYVEDGRPL